MLPLAETEAALTAADVIKLPPVMLPLAETVPATFNPVVVTTTTLLVPLIEILALPLAVAMFTSLSPL